MSLFPPIGPTESKKYLKFGRERAEGRKQRQKLYEEKYMKQSKAPFSEVEKLVEFLNGLEEAGSSVPPWRRTVHGYQVLVDNCADPALSYLEFKPEILNAAAYRAELESLRKRVHELEVYRDVCNNLIKADEGEFDRIEKERDAWKAKAVELEAGIIRANNNHDFHRERADRLTKALEHIEHVYEARSELHTNDAELAQNLAAFARQALAPDVAKLGEDIA